MNRSRAGFCLASSILAGRWPWAVGLALAAALIAVPLPGKDADQGGGSPYVPTRGEWLCLVLNTQVALVSSEHLPDNVMTRFVYDRAQPDTIQIETLFSPAASKLQVEREMAVAKQLLARAARIRGWEAWIKVELKRTKIDGPPSFENVDP